MSTKYAQWSAAAEACFAGGDGQPVLGKGRGAMPSFTRKALVRPNPKGALAASSAGRGWALIHSRLLEWTKA